MSLKSPLKWVGGKSWLAPTLSKIFHSKYSDLRWVEPFVGGMSIALEVNPNRALLSDSNLPLITFYRALQEGLIIDSELINSEEEYYKLRSKFNGNITDKEVAILFYYLNRTCHRGLYRENSRGEFNVPYGHYNKLNYIYDFRDYTEVVKNWEFEWTDHCLLGQYIEYDDFIYCDPPYDGVFSGYSYEGFNWEDHQSLVEWLDCFSNPTIVSNAATDRVIQLYQTYGYQIYFVQAPRRIGGNRENVKEILAFKNIDLEESLLCGIM